MRPKGSNYEISVDNISNNKTEKLILPGSIVVGVVNKMATIEIPLFSYDQSVKIVSWFD